MQWNNFVSADTREGNYYVTAQDGDNTYPMAGPFINNHAAALQAVYEVKEAACDIDRRSVFMAWGTVRFPMSYDKPAPLNKIVGL